MNIRLEIDGQEVEVAGGASIMAAAGKLGIYIPHFCWHPKLSIAANCRMCLVEVEKSSKPAPACATPASNGMVVRTHSAAARRAQNSVMEFLLINHPLDCPICDQGGECQLQDLAMGYGVSRSRYREEKRVVVEKNLGPLIATDMTRCIHCTRCVRFGREVAGIMELGMTGRGEHVEIMPFVERTVDSELSGNMIDICPVGALTSKPFRFAARTWELARRPGIGEHDSWGSQVMRHVIDGKVKRVTPRRVIGMPDAVSAGGAFSKWAPAPSDEARGEYWISDRDRFSYLGLAAKDRALRPLLRLPGGKKLFDAGWPEAMDALVKKLGAAIARHGADKIGFFCSPRATCEEMHLLQKIARGLGCRLDTRLRRRDFSAGSLSGFGREADDIAAARHILFVGAAPAKELPLLAARLRQTKRCRVASIGALDLRNTVPLGAQFVRRPGEWPELLAQLIHFLRDSGGRKTALENTDDTPALKGLADSMRKAAEGNLILLGDGAQTAALGGEIVRFARAAAAQTGGRAGVLTDGCNGVGAVKMGAQINDTAAMLRAELKAIVLFNCEPADFAEREILSQAVARADFVVAVTPFSGGVESFVDCVLPLAAAAETGGAYINGGGVWQSFQAAVPPPGESRPGWKILRLLGEKFNVDGFSFSALEEVSTAARLQAAQFVADETDKTAPAAAAATTSGGDVFDLIGGAAIYDGDMLARRSSALQATRAGRDAALAFINPKDMARLSLSAGADIRLGDGSRHWRTRVYADPAVAAGAVLAYPPNLSTATVSLSAAPDEEQDEAQKIAV